MNPWVIAAGAGLGFLKGKEDKKAHREAQEVEAAKAKYSPWTGMQAQSVGPSPSMMGAMMQGATAGAMMGDIGEGNEELTPGKGEEVTMNTRRKKMGMMNGVMKA